MKKTNKKNLLNYTLLLTVISILFISDSYAAKSFFETTIKFDYLENIFNNKQKYILFLTVFFPSVYFFKNKSWFLFSIFFILQLFFVVYWDSISSWIQNLAGDSISEINNFNYDYALAWINSIIVYFEANLEIENFIKFYLIGFILFYFLLKTRIREKIIYKYFPLCLLGIFIILFININVTHLFKNINMQSTVKTNFNNIVKTHKINKNTNVIIYIGESTSSIMTYDKINYIKKKLELKNYGKLINYKNTYSTHTHSTPSLLRALSLPKSIDKQNLLKPIIDRKSIPIFNFFKEKVNTNYISSTGKEGYNNIHYSIFFKNFDHVSFLKNSSFKFEKDFFIQEFKKRKSFENENNLYVFHSAVGHAPYYKNVPEKYLKDNDKKFDQTLLTKIIGNEYKFKKNIHIPDYISNIDYSFDTVSELLSLINNETPTVFIYLSDHGESVFTGYGHDSSRFVHEMLRIPFFVYFNKKFLENNDNIFKKINKEIDQIITTDYLPKLLLKIYKLDTYFKEYFLKENTKFENLIFKRKIKDRINFIDINFNKSKLPKKFKEINDNDTKLNVLATNIGKDKICYHSSNTIARIKRGSIITDCLELDLVIDNNNFFIYHPPKENIDLTLDDVMKNLNQVKSLWIDAKNLNETNCDSFFNKIISIKKDLSIFVEFPSETNLKNDDIKSCMKNLRKNNIDVSYYLSNVLIDKCLEKLSKENQDCKRLLKKVNLIDGKADINNVSFDFKFNKIINLFNYKPKNIKLNTWHIDFEEVKNLNMKLYNFVIPYNSKFNANTY